MGKFTLKEHILGLINTLSWRLFLWSSNMNQEEFWDAIYEQEKQLRRNKN